MYVDNPPAIIQYEPNWFERYFPEIRQKVDKMYRDDIIAKTIKEEGGYNNVLGDSGGPTNMGITLKTLQQVNPAATIQDVKNLSYAAAAQIYIDKYWNQNQLMHMPIQIQDLVFDMNVNMGLHGSALVVQYAINDLGSNEVEDGIIGTSTLNEINKYDVTDLRAAIVQERKDWYNDIVKAHPSQSKFLAGWMKRVDDFAPIPAEAIKEA